MPSSSSSSARGCSTRRSPGRRRTRTTCSRSAGGSTASRWRSSSRPPGSAPCRPGCCASGSTERLALLTGGPRDLPARQQTLRETIDWSYDLLDEDERALLARLSVFPAGATLDAVGRVCLDGDDGRALDLVERLLDASLLAVHDGPVERRYRMLETVRQYAAGRLQDGDAAETSRRHAEWCLALAETAEQELSGKDQSRWFATLEAEHDNLRAALDHLGQRRRPSAEAAPHGRAQPLLVRPRVPVGGSRPSRRCARRRGRPPGAARAQGAHGLRRATPCCRATTRRRPARRRRPSTPPGATASRGSSRTR